MKLRLITVLCKKVGGCHFGKLKNKQDKIDPKLGFALLNDLYSTILHSFIKEKKGASALECLSINERSIQNESDDTDR
jgi:hypothetical protein